MITASPAASHARQPTLVAFSFGGFQVDPDGLMDDYLFALTGKERPTVCLLGTASGDSEVETVKFVRAFMGRAELTYAPAYRYLRPGDDPVARLLEADLIYVPGGNTPGAVATWEALGWDDVLRRAWLQGTVVAAMCAGAMGLFEHYACKWHRRPRLGQGIGLLPGTLGCHFNEASNPSHPLLRDAIADGVIPGGFGLDDGFALRFAGTELVECVRSRPGARGRTLRADGAGGLVETELAADLLADRVELAVDRGRKAALLTPLPASVPGVAA
ncbi:MAG TPA: Type 1 glutamine amidotransferase-like domain-containing protein [Baekduia sp.]|nr:Type 1 glutamine amidotransferase-like domain-containing protein [Baekduia sp.]